MAAGKIKVEISEEKVRVFLRAPDGPLFRYMMVVGEAVKSETVASLKEGFPQDFLGPTIVKRVVRTPAGPAVEVGSDHTKTDPHPIVGNPRLVFFWPKPKGPGKVVAFRRVNHPGSEFHDYLVKQLLAAVKRVAGRIT